MKSCRIENGKVLISGEEVDIELNPNQAVIPNFVLDGNYQVNAKTLITLIAAYSNCCYKYYDFEGYKLVPNDIVEKEIIKEQKETIKKLKNEKEETFYEKNIISNKNYLYNSIICELKGIIEKHNKSSWFGKIKFDYESIVNKYKVKLSLN